MAIYSIRRENETVEKLINRFKKQVQNSRIVLKVKSKKHWVKPLTKRLIRLAAIKRSYYRKKRSLEKFSN